MKPLLLLVLAGILAFYQSDAQSLSPVVIGSSGAFYQNGSAMLSSTVGEMTSVETYSAGSSILTQGFQQAFDFGVGIYDQSSTHFPEVFPNPSSGEMTIALPGSAAGEIELHVFDAAGKLVFKKTFVNHESSRLMHLSLNNLVDGMYVFELRTKTEKFVSKVNIVK